MTVYGTKDFEDLCAAISKYYPPQNDYQRGARDMADKYAEYLKQKDEWQKAKEANPSHPIAHGKEAIEILSEIVPQLKRGMIDHCPEKMWQWWKRQQEIVRKSSREILP